MSTFITRKKRAPYNWVSCTLAELSTGILSMEYTGISICLDPDRKILEILRRLRDKIDADPAFSLPRLFHIHEQDVPHMDKLSAISAMLVARCKARNPVYRSHPVSVVDWRNLIVKDNT